MLNVNDDKVAEETDQLVRTAWDALTDFRLVAGTRQGAGYNPRQVSGHLAGRARTPTADASAVETLGGFYNIFMERNEIPTITMRGFPEFRIQLNYTGPTTDRQTSTSRHMPD